MRDCDLDIKIEDLYVAHRADFIRAFLLKKFGGLWIDSDCVVIKSIQPLIDILNMYDFVGYRERSGDVTNNFMGASLNSTIASNYYNRVCKILRSGQQINWLTIGSEALTATLNEGKASWYELKVEQIQPVCWSNPAAFLKKLMMWYISKCLIQIPFVTWYLPIWLEVISKKINIRIYLIMIHFSASY
ncbi:capsular polysaccharide synthesis protein [Pedobacter steynii]